MKTFRSWFLAAAAVLMVAGMLTHGPSGKVRAQKKGGGIPISPVFTVFPERLQTAQGNSDALLCVHNGNSASNTTIDPGDAFSFTLSNTCATQFVLVEFALSQCHSTNEIGLE